jgi:hypothetical protein
MSLCGTGWCLEDVEEKVDEDCVQYSVRSLGRQW